MAWVVERGKTELVSINEIIRLIYAKISAYKNARNILMESFSITEDELKEVDKIRLHDFPDLMDK